MTGREALRRAGSHSYTSEALGSAGGCLLLFAAATNGRRLPTWAGVSLVVAAVAVFLAGVAYAAYLRRCPWCRAAWHPLQAQVQLGELDRIDSCPHCARSLDDEVPGTPGPPKPGAKSNAKPKSRGDGRDDEFS